MQGLSMCPCNFVCLGQQVSGDPAGLARAICPSAQSWPGSQASCANSEVKAGCDALRVPNLREGKEAKRKRIAESGAQSQSIEADFSKNLRI